jgi:hypothetical protein
MAEAGLPLALRERLAGELDALSLRAPSPGMARYRLEPAAARQRPSLGLMVAAAAALAVGVLFAASPEHAPQKLAIQVVSHLERAHGTDPAPARPATGHPANPDRTEVDDREVSSDAQMERAGTVTGPAAAQDPAGTGAGRPGAGSGPGQGESEQEMSQERAAESEPGPGSRSAPPKRSPQPREGSNRDAGRARGNGD